MPEYYCYYGDGMRLYLSFGVPNIGIYETLIETLGVDTNAAVKRYSELLEAWKAINLVHSE